MIRFLASLCLALSFIAPAAADDEADMMRHALSAPMLEKFHAATAELEKLGIKTQGKEVEDKSLAELGKFAESKPGVKPILAKHGFTGRTYFLTAHTLVYAGMYLGMESGLSKKDQAAQLAAMTPQMRANIDLLRKNPKLYR